MPKRQSCGSILPCGLPLSNQCRPSIHQPTVDEFRMPAEMSIALSRAHLHARMHVASCWRAASTIEIATNIRSP
jgi:hypothetical protein